MPTIVGRDEAQKSRVSCRGCGGINEYFRNEIQSRIVSDYGGGRDEYNWINCAGCGKEISVRRT